MASESAGLGVLHLNLAGNAVAQRHAASDSSCRSQRLIILTPSHLSIDLDLCKAPRDLHQIKKPE